MLKLSVALTIQVPLAALYGALWLLDVVGTVTALIMVGVVVALPFAVEFYLRNVTLVTHPAMFEAPAEAIPLGEEARGEAEEASAKSQFDVIICGAGVAGCAMSAMLSKFQNRRVLVVEKLWDEDKNAFNGEVLYPPGQAIMKKYGLLHYLTDLGHTKVTEAMLTLAGTQPVRLTFPEHNGEGLDLKSLKRFKVMNNYRVGIEEIAAEDARLTIVKNAAVTQITIDNGRATGIKYTLDNQEFTATAPLVIESTGRVSSLRKQLVGTPEPSARYCADSYVAIQSTRPTPKHLRDEYGHSKRGQWFLTDFGHLLIYQVGGDDGHIRAAACVAQNNMPKDRDAFFKNEALPALPKELRDFLSSDTENMRVHQNIIQKAKIPQAQGVVLVGDSLDTRHAMTGTGQTCALTGAETLVSLLKEVDDFQNSEKLDAAIKEYYSKRSTHTASASIMALIVNSVLRKATPLRAAFVHYFNRFGAESYGHWRANLAGALFCVSCDNETALFWMLISVVIEELSTHLYEGRPGEAWRVLRDAMIKADHVYSTYSTQWLPKGMFSVLKKVVKLVDPKKIAFEV